MRQLLINLNNTNTSFAIAERLELRHRQKIPTRDLSQAEQIVRDLEASCDQAVICSVVPEAGSLLDDWLGANVLKVSYKLDVGFDLSQYPAPESLGADRIANVAHAVSLGNFPCVVADFGTAITYDVVTADGQFAGGVIAPGLAAYVDFLPSSTAQLPKFEFGRPARAIATNTHDALQSGAFHSLIGATHSILQNLTDECGEKKDQVFMIATGGYCELMNNSMPGIFQRIDPDFTIHGIRIIGERNSTIGQ